MSKEYKPKYWNVVGAKEPIRAATPAGALGIFLKRGRFGLSDNWQFTRQPDGWVVATNVEGRNLERKSYRLREVEYNRFA